MAQMLYSCLFPVKRTSIMYAAALSYAQLKSHMKVLESRGLVVKVDDLWVITSKGREFLEAYRIVSQFINQ